MSFLKNIFGSEKSKKPLSRVKLTRETIIYFEKYNALLESGGIKFDAKGQLRYLHGAPVGDMVLVRVNKDGTPIYKMSAEGWFDPDSQTAKDFVWP